MSGEENDDLPPIVDLVASVNHDAAEAVNRASGLTDRPAPHLGLRNLQHDLRDLFAETARALDQVERAMDNRDAAIDDTPRRIISDHADRLKEQYDGPVLNLALMLLEANRREWLHRKEGTNGADAVRRHGLTENQRSWLNELQDAYEDRPEMRTDGGQTVSDEVRCGYCDSPHLAYRLKSDRGEVCRCIECLAIEQGQQQFSLPFDAWLDRDMVEPPDQDEFPDAPDFDAFDPREHDYNTARAWFSVLARIKDDDPIVKRDPDAIGTIFEDTREFLINVMGSDAHKRPSELREGDQ